MTEAANIQGTLHVETPLGSRKKKIRKFAGAEKTLYVNRPVLNADELIAWAKQYAGCETCVTPDDMHVTIAFSEQPLAWPKKPMPGSLSIHVENAHVALFGPKHDCVVLQFESDELDERWQFFMDQGASWKWDGYHPHVTLSYQGFNPNGITPQEIPPFTGTIVLGPEEFSELNDDWKSGVVQKVGWSDAAREASIEARRHSRTSRVLDHADRVHSKHPLTFNVDPKTGPTKEQMEHAARMMGKPIKKTGDSMNDDFLEQDRLQKVGRRNNKSDQSMIQQMHDHACKLGADCNGLMGYDALTPQGESYDKVARIAKIDESLGLVFGYAIVCQKDGKPYYDLNIDKQEDGTYKRVPEHIPEDAMLKAAVDFAKSSRVGNEMHAGPDTGEYVFVFPMTADIAKAFGIQTRTTGLMIAYKPTPEVFAKFKSGDYTGFSIEGRRVSVTEAE